MGHRDAPRECHFSSGISAQTHFVQSPFVQSPFVQSPFLQSPFLQNMAAHQPATFAGVAQSVEHLFCKQKVRGSSPLPSSSEARSKSTARQLPENTAAQLPENTAEQPRSDQRYPNHTISNSAVATRGWGEEKSLEGFPSGQWEQAVNLPAFAFVGSNPTPSTSIGQAQVGRE
jgi:hypothetical protein